MLTARTPSEEDECQEEDEACFDRMVAKQESSAVLLPPKTEDLTNFNEQNNLV